MPVPSTIDDLSTTAGSNSPSGSETPSEGDNYIRTLSAFIAALRDKLDGTSATGTITDPIFDGTATGTLIGATFDGATLTNTTTAGYISTPTVSAVSAYKSGSSSVAAGTNTVVFDTEATDRASNYANGTGIFTAPKTGLYAVQAMLTLANGTLSSLTFTGAYFSINNGSSGANYLPMSSLVDIVGAGGGSFFAAGGAMIPLSSGDTVRVKTEHSGANLTHQVSSRLSINWVG
jgi:hypothetical protein